LINAHSGEIVQRLTDGVVLDHSFLQEIGHLDVTATTRPSRVGSVLFLYDGGAYSWVENTHPYAMMQDIEGDFAAKPDVPWIPSPGSHRIEAIAYSGAQRSGDPGEALIITFTVR
jgi:hypothetical protein